MSPALGRGGFHSVSLFWDAAWYPSRTHTQTQNACDSSEFTSESSSFYVFLSFEVIQWAFSVHLMVRNKKEIVRGGAERLRMNLCSLYQLVFVCRLQMEGHVQPGEAALLWRAGKAEQAAPRALPRLQIQTPAKTHLHCRGTKAEGRRVQSHDEEPQTGAESDLHTQVENYGGQHFHTILRYYMSIDVCIDDDSFHWQDSAPPPPHTADNACASQSSFFFLRIEITAGLFLSLSSTVNIISQQWSF